MTTDRKSGENPNKEIIKTGKQKLSGFILSGYNSLYYETGCDTKHVFK